jgi:hypothetical protein
MYSILLLYLIFTILYVAVKGCTLPWQHLGISVPAHFSFLFVPTHVVTQIIIIKLCSMLLEIVF